MITRPFTYVATANAIAWPGLHVLRSTYGRMTWVSTLTRYRERSGPASLGSSPCTHSATPAISTQIETVAAATGLPTIDDAAACFGVRFKQQSITNFGSFLCRAFHASKVFSTVEGGASIFGDDDLYEVVRAIVHHGCTRDRAPSYLGLNAKLSELHAAFGLCMLEIDPIRVSARDARSSMDQEQTCR